MPRVFVCIVFSFASSLVSGWQSEWCDGFNKNPGVHLPPPERRAASSRPVHHLNSARRVLHPGEQGAVGQPLDGRGSGSGQKRA